MPFEIREATKDDVDFLVQADITTDMEDAGYRRLYTDEEAEAHHKKIIAFLSDANKGAWIATNDKLKMGMILSRYRDYEEAAKIGIAFKEIGRAVFPEDGRFCEVYQLRVMEDYRRRGIATQLKRQIEIEAKKRGIRLIYTHTAIEHVFQMNIKLGYREVRRGTIWDDVVRFSLVKDL